MPSEASNLPYEISGDGWRLGSRRASSIVKHEIMIADITKTALQLHSPAIKLAIGLANIIPSRSPLMIVPTTLPLRSSDVI
ncbi:hypothetical protein D3C76_1443650 [compost metagenome]